MIIFLCIFMVDSFPLLIRAPDSSKTQFEPFLPSLPLQLLHDFPELLRHGQADARGVFGDGDAFVSAVKENHGGSEHAAAADDLCVEEVRHTDEAEDHHLLTDALEACLA